MFTEASLGNGKFPNPDIHGITKNFLSQGATHLRSLAQNLKDRVNGIFDITPSTSRRHLIQGGAVLATAIILESQGINVFPAPKKAAAKDGGGDGGPESIPPPPEIITIPDLYQIKDYIAGGEFLDLDAELKNRAFIYPSEVPFVLSTSTYQNLIAELVEQGINDPTPAQIYQLATDGRYDALLNLEPTQVAFVENDRIYAMSGDAKTGKAQTFLLTQDGPELITYPDNTYYRPPLKWSNDRGIVGTDGYKITHQFDPNSGQWNELKDYVALGTPQQRINKSLLQALEEPIVSPQGETIFNYFNLDRSEVDYYIQTGNDQGLKSFQVLKDANGNPAFFITTKGTAGIINPNNVQDIKSAVNRLNEIDPTIIRSIADRGGLRIISNWLFLDHYNVKPSSYSFVTDLGLIEVPDRVIGRVGMSNFMEVLLEEPRHMYNMRHLVSDGGSKWVYQAPDQLADKTGIDKGRFEIEWAKANAQRLTPRELDAFIRAGNSTIANYSSSLLAHVP
ncbi:hypothetical protein HYW43_01495 [Candidatus Daviesbacteria bacterium]|nr:hypothetical protein [Candidatus Daviesbacteria bacterium]